MTRDLRGAQAVFGGQKPELLLVAANLGAGALPAQEVWPSVMLLLYDASSAPISDSGVSRFKHFTLCKCA